MSTEKKPLGIAGARGCLFRPELRGGDIFFSVDLKLFRFSARSVWCPTPSRGHRVKPYSLPRSFIIGTRPTPDNGARFSPPPYAVVLSRGGRHLLAAAGARGGGHAWNMAEFSASCGTLRARLRLDAGSASETLRGRVRLLVLESREGESRHELLSRGMRILYPAAFDAPPKPPPAWWLKPVYCGWGDQVAASLHMEGPGREQRARAYCTQGLYGKWVDRLAAAGVPVGTVIIDAGWSNGAVWAPEPGRWPDLGGFIKKQHGKGRKVLLWIPAWEHGGLPERWCVRSGKKLLSADPGNPEYRAFLGRQVKRLLSPEGFDADGFKIDKLGFDPGRIFPPSGYDFRRSSVFARLPRGARVHGAARGIELLYLLQKEIYRAAKEAKQDALLTSSTVHPLFHDTFDMVRLHDTGSVNGNVTGGMKARAELARAVLPRHPVDTDNWIHKNYSKWMEYTLESPRIGVPCIFYSERFVLSFKRNPAVRKVPFSDLRKIGRKWREQPGGGLKRRTGS